MAGALKHTFILYPVLIKVPLTISVLVLLGPARRRSMHANRQRLDDPAVALGRNEWRQEAAKRGNNDGNPCEWPLLFYAVVAFSLITGAADGPMIALSWLFAASHSVHAVIHIEPNIVPWRGLAIIVGAVVLLVMGVRLALHVATAG
jgi:hypothetical protein